MTHNEAAQKFKRCRDKAKGYRLGNNTRLQQRGRAFAVRYHDTDVVMIRPDGTYRLYSGGWYTLTTKDRIRRFSPCFLSQTNDMWHVGDTPFYEGMLIDAEGNPIDDQPKHTMDEIWKLKRHVDRRFNQFFKLIVETMRGHDVGTWESFRNHTVPRDTSRQHLKKLWDAVLTETSGRGGSPGFIWVYFAIRNLNFRDPSLVFQMIRQDAMNGRVSEMTQSHIRSFLRRRKQPIINLILAGELNDGRVRVSSV